MSLALMLNMFSVVWRSNMGSATRFRLRSRPYQYKRRRRSKNECLRCVLTSPAKENAKIGSSLLSM